MTEPKSWENSWKEQPDAEEMKKEWNKTKEKGREQEMKAEYDEPL
jgi:hypothetical protein